MEVVKLKEMIRLGIAAAKAGEAFRELILVLGKLKKQIKPKYKQWQHPYKYHR